MKRETIGQDLRKKNEDLCTMWKCEKYESEMPCTYCPVLKDLLQMAYENNIVMPAWNYFMSLTYK